MTHALILASASPRRAELLEEIGMEFSVVPGRAEELQPEHLTPTEACLLNAYHKARAVAKKFPDALVIGADTEVVLGKRVFGKPRNMSDARAMLTALSGKAHQVITGVCLIQLRHRVQRLFFEQTIVKFRDLDPEDIVEYLEKIDPLDKAGAYAIQEHGDDIIESIEGSHSNVVGLPVERLREELHAVEMMDEAMA
jgi:septum formation protein